ncbi:MAG TPA: fused MFS/spermidine synthase [Planctomycetota bacterium]|nr:fused MFS/spermidine synthase [Planctomycetota bacterium]
MLRYALTIFFSAFLLFQVQPFIGKYILPWFGGTPAVWTTCMLFFQVVLLGGYLYAHLVNTYVKPRKQVWLHLALLAVSLAFLPVMPDAGAWKPTGELRPVSMILLLLLVNIGMPYFLLSTTGPLLQSWFTRTHPGRSPYRLYALSNAGSLLALVSYPFVFEPTFRLATQGWGWSVGYGVFVLLAAWCALRLYALGNVAVPDAAGASDAPEETPAPDDDETVPVAASARPDGKTVLLWLALAMCGSVMLLATTNQMCQEVAVVPFLWVVPLALYLLTFILCFDSPRWYIRPVFGVLLLAAVVIGTVLLFMGVTVPLMLQIVGYSWVMFVCCMVCHGELVRSKPHPKHLTLFYLMVSVGGALGGVFVVLVATHLFNGFWEYHIGLAGTLVLAVLAWFRDPGWVLYRGRPVWASCTLGVIFVALVVALAIEARESYDVAIDMTRNFYGLLRTEQYDKECGVLKEDVVDPAEGEVSAGTGEAPLRRARKQYFEVRRLLHGRIDHGFQFTDLNKRRWTTCYFGPDSGVGVLLNAEDGWLPPANPHGPGRRIGIIGLGAGSIAAYGAPGDVIRYYEINPEVIRMCRKYFTYIDDAGKAGAKIDILLGDARNVLEDQLKRGEPQQFDVLVVDAFSSDAIPMHLLTRECAETYFKHIKPDGFLAVHISNRYVDLKPVVRGFAEEFGRTAVLVEDWAVADKGIYGGTWVLVTQNEDFLNSDRYASVRAWPKGAEPLVWTDDYSSLFRVLK